MGVNLTSRMCFSLSSLISLHLQYYSNSLQVLHDREKDYICTSLDFSSKGEYMVASCSDSTIRLYDCQTAYPEKVIKVNASGATITKFTQHKNTVCFEIKHLRFLFLDARAVRRYQKITSLTIPFFPSVLLVFFLTPFIYR